MFVLYFSVTIVYRVLDDLKYKYYHSQMERFLQLFHNRPVAAALYKKVQCTNNIAEFVCCSYMTLYWQRLALASVVCIQQTEHYMTPNVKDCMCIYSVCCCTNNSCIWFLSIN